MQTYSETVTEIHSWLSSLQVDQKWIDANIKQNQLHFELIHPQLGKTKVTHSLATEGILRAHGIALELWDIKDERAKFRVYDYGGIWDPIDEYVPGEHYATSHFALLSAILFNINKQPHFLDKATQAFEFHLYTCKDEYRLSNWMYHWDFQNYALIECYRRLKDHVAEDIKQHWQQALKQWRSNHRNKLTNWAAMRALSHVQRYQTFGNWLDLFRYKRNEMLIYKAEHRNGCFDDELNVSRSIQYHIYTVALLHRLYLSTQRKRHAQSFLRGVEFLLKFVDPDGDFNYWGRGQEQVFGYGAAVYALTAAANLTGERRYEQVADKVYDYLLQFKRGDHFPLVLNDHEDAKRVGWRDYHHTTVYNAFLAVWLGFAEELRRSKIQSINVANAFEKPDLTETDFAFLRNENFFVALGSGLSHYASEMGLSPCHIWVKDLGAIYSCPGGAMRETFGKFYGDGLAEKNCLAPLAVNYDGTLYSPANKTGKIDKCTQDSIDCFLDYGIFEVHRRMAISSAVLQITDEIVFKQECAFEEFRVFNLPIVLNRFRFEIQDEELVISGAKRTLCIKCDASESRAMFELLEIIKTAKGRARIISRISRNLRVASGDRLTATTTIKPDGHVSNRTHEVDASEQTAL